MRRAALAAGFALAAFGIPVLLSAQSVGSPAPVRLADDVEVRLLAPGVWVHTTKDSTGFPSNGLVLETSSGPVLVDTAWTPEQTERLLAWASSTLGRPVQGAVVTHFHNDRLGGLAALERAKIPALAVDLTVERAEGPRPGVLFPAASTEQGDPRGFVAFYPGPGRSPDNIVVYVPAARVLFGGCLVKSENAPGLGFLGAADPARWPDAIRRVQARFPAAAHVVPGHGAVGTSAALAHTLELLRAHPPPK